MRKLSIKDIRVILLSGIVLVGSILAGLVLSGTSAEKVRKVFSGILIGLISFFGVSGLIESEEAKSVSNDLYFVNEVIDGDTIKIEGNTRLRLIGIDAPEINECYYQKSRDELIRLVQGKYVKLEKDIESVDGYGRLLRYVYLPSKELEEDDIFVNKHLLHQGYAQTLFKAPNKRYRMLFIRAREEALMNKRGLWSDECNYLEKFEQENKSTREIDEPPSDPNCLIKGNISSRGYGKLYFLPNCPNYSQVKIDTSKGEEYFCTEKEAIAAGFEKSGDCP